MAKAEAEEQTQYAIFSCPGTVSRCVNSFADTFSLTVVETITDGDCFFDSLLLSGAIMAPAEQEQLRKEQRLALRNRLVDYLQTPEILDELAPFGYEDIFSNIEKLRKARVYRCDAGDLPTQFAHKAFGIHLNVFVIDYHKATKRTVVTLEKHVNDNPHASTVNVLRIGEHFKLLKLKDITQADLDELIRQGILAEKKSYNERRGFNVAAATKVNKKRAAEKAKEERAAEKEKQKRAAKKAKEERAANAANAASAAKSARGKTKKSDRENTEENIMKRMLKLSLKTAQEEEEKRQKNATKKNRALSAARKQMAENEAFARELAGLNLKNSPKSSSTKKNKVKAKTQKEWAAELGLSVPTISKLQKEMREQGLTMNLKNYKAAMNAKRNLSTTAKTQKNKSPTALNRAFMKMNSTEQLTQEEAKALNDFKKGK
jgi:hypothetical protein